MPGTGGTARGCEGLRGAVRGPSSHTCQGALRGLAARTAPCPGFIRQPVCRRAMQNGLSRWSGPQDGHKAPLHPHGGHGDAMAWPCPRSPPVAALTPQAPASGAWLEGGEAVQAGLLRRDQGSLVPSTCEVTARGPQSAPGRGPRRAPPAGTLTSDSQPPGPSAARWPQPAGQHDGGSEERGLMIPSAVTAEGVTAPQPWGKKPGKCPLKPEVFLVLLTQSLRTQGSRRGSGPGRAWCRPRGSPCSPGPR